MRACTAVVTEIAHHNKATIDADISFLSEQEWRQELGVLLHDLVDEDGNIKRITDLKSDAGVAWQKVSKTSCQLKCDSNTQPGPRCISGDHPGGIVENVREPNHELRHS